MPETIQITTPDDQPRSFVATFQASSSITAYGTGTTPLYALTSLFESLRDSFEKLSAHRDRLTPELREELLAIETYVNTLR